MQATKCPTCGAPVPPGAVRCDYCGAALSEPSPPAPFSPVPLTEPYPGAPPPFSPSAPPAGLGGQPYGTTAATPPPRRRGRRIAIIAVVVVVVLIVAGLGYYFLVAQSNVAVDNMFVWAPDNVCGLGAEPIYYSGFNASTMSTQTFELQIPNFNNTSCTLRTVVTNTSGFTVTTTELPLAVPGYGNGSLNVSIAVPGTAFSGNLNLVYA